jgi:hypothetical protein
VHGNILNQTLTNVECIAPVSRMLPFDQASSDIVVVVVVEDEVVATVVVIAFVNSTSGELATPSVTAVAIDSTYSDDWYTSKKLAKSFLLLHLAI